MFPVSLYTSVIKQCEWTLEMSVCHPILQVGLLLKHLQLKVLQLLLFTVVRRPDSGVPPLRVLGCKLERRQKWTEFGGHLRSWWTFVYLTKAPYNWAQFVTTDSFCSKEAQIWSGTDVNSFSLCSVWTTGTKFKTWSRQTRALNAVHLACLFTALRESPWPWDGTGTQLSRVFPILGTPLSNLGSHWKTRRQGTPSSGHTEDVPGFDLFLFSNPCCHGSY